MSKKKERAFFVCPRWNELVAPSQVMANLALSAAGSARIMSSISAGQPVARSTLLKALFAVRRSSGVIIDVNSYIVDQRILKGR